MDARFRGGRKRTVPEAIRTLIPATEIDESTREMLRQLGLSEDTQERVLFEITCLQILGIHFAIVEVFEEDPQKMTALLDAYYAYWSAYSKAVSVNYGEEAYKRLPAYREAFIGHRESEPVHAVGKVFADRCEVSDALSALGSNVFGSVFTTLSHVQRSFEIDFQGE